MLFALSILASTVQTEDREDETGSGSLRKKRAHQIQPYRGTRGGPRRSAARAAARRPARDRETRPRETILEASRAPTGAGLLGIIATCGVKAGMVASGQGASCPFSVRVATEAE